jgi:hypothetical protein
VYDQGFNSRRQYDNKICPLSSRTFAKTDYDKLRSGNYAVVSRNVITVGETAKLPNVGDKITLTDTDGITREFEVVELIDEYPLNLSAHSLGVRYDWSPAPSLISRATRKNQAQVKQGKIFFTDSLKVSANEQMQVFWTKYQADYDYASDITFEVAVDAAKEILDLINNL